jgi:Cyclophilin type peptidyl-prolyl cis-trans isomerase/CLD
MKSTTPFLSTLLLACTSQLTTAWVVPSWSFRQASTPLGLKHNSNNQPNNPQRRELLQSLATTLVVGIVPSVANAQGQRAVGGAEIDCRAAGNCLEIGQLDGAVGWTWGGKDRCDATDPRCGPDGQLGELPVGKEIPKVTNKITHVAEIVVDIGREETGVLHLGFYGEDCPGSVSEMLQFLTSGIVTTNKLVFENGMGIKSAPVSLLQGGKIPDIVPSKLVDFGVPSQSMAYSRSRGLRSAGDEFMPQPRPNPDKVKDDAFPRKHDVAGLISIPSKGIGYGGSGFEPDDEAYESAFQITADAVPSLDKANRRVIGQVIDAPSMAFLARLASLPTKKGIKGVIPGQTSGPPLLKVTVRDVEAKKVDA